jgi:hypothetical protein
MVGHCTCMLAHAFSGQIHTLATVLSLAVKCSNDSRSRWICNFQDFDSRQLIGEGQFGRVMKCTHTYHDGPGDSCPQKTTVAIKVFKNSTAETHAYCGRELAMMSVCQHTCITKVGTALQLVSLSSGPSATIFASSLQTGSCPV